MGEVCHGAKRRPGGPSPSSKEAQGAQRAARSPGEPGAWRGNARQRPQLGVFRFGSASLTQKGERGSTVVLGAIGIAVLLVTLTGAANVVVDEYAKGALRTAVDEAAQAGASAAGPDAVAACLQESAAVRANLLRGPFGADVTVACQVVGGLMVATATGSLPSLLPVVPRASVSVTGVSVMQEAPAQ